MCVLCIKGIVESSRVECERVHNTRKQICARGFFSSLFVLSESSSSQLTSSSSTCCISSLEATTSMIYRTE